MFARSISIRLKPNSLAEFTQMIEKETLPQLRKQKGFQDEITFVATGGREAFAISLWDEKENADAYSRDTYPGVLKALGKVVEGMDTVKSICQVPLLHEQGTPQGAPARPVKPVLMKKVTAMEVTATPAKPPAKGTGSKKGS